MKTRQEMIYDFMVALAANAEFYKEWHEDSSDDGYGENVYAFAQELADEYLRSLG
jgi:hypothetical protein